MSQNPTAVVDLTTATPAEIDTVLARIMGDRAVLSMQFESVWHRIHDLAGDKKVGRSWRSRDWGMTDDEAFDALTAVASGNITYVGDMARSALARLADLRIEVEVLDEEERPLLDEYHRRGGWTRAFLATSANGHIHRSRECSTCYATTQFFWFTDLSGHDEAEIVTKAGSDACTVCYPSAPVNDLKRPRSIFSDDEKAAQQARVEREQAKNERLAKKIANGLTADGSEFKVSYVEHNQSISTYNRETRQREYSVGSVTRTERFKTERAALQWVVQYVSWGDDLHTSAKAPAYRQIVEAVAAKHNQSIEQVEAEIKVKVAAKIKRDSR